jgi:predicted phosphohydrolase
MRLAWLTDVHLNFLKAWQLSSFCAEVVDASPDAVVLTGDLSEAPQLLGHLRLLEEHWSRPIYFVLGNHDYYRSSIASVRTDVVELTSKSKQLHWLQTSGVIRLSEHTVLVGHDGWADGRAGDYAHSNVMLNDYLLIRELVDPPSGTVLRQLQVLAAEAADHLRQVVPQALEMAPHVVVAIHVPPFAEACWHEGKISDDHWLPHFTCVAAGEVLLELMRTRPDRQMTVLCGHTHSGGTYQPLPNLVVHTGGAKYGQPALQRVLDL